MASLLWLPSTGTQELRSSMLELMSGGPEWRRSSGYVTASLFVWLVDLNFTHENFEIFRLLGNLQIPQKMAQSKRE